MRTAHLLLLLSATGAFAGGKGAAPLKVPKLELGFAPIPRGEELKPATAPELREERPAARPDEEQISVVSVVHGKELLRTPKGVEPRQPLEAVLLEGRPPTTERFSTAVRVRSVPRVDLLVEISLVDPWGKSVMWNEGTVSFRGSTRQEQDYAVDWNPTALRAPGKYTVEVKLDRRTVGSWPLDIRAAVQPETPDGGTR